MACNTSWAGTNGAKVEDQLKSFQQSIERDARRYVVAGNKKVLSSRKYIAFPHVAGCMLYIYVLICVNAYLQIYTTVAITVIAISITTI